MEIQIRKSLLPLLLLFACYNLQAQVHITGHVYYQQKSLQNASVKLNGRKTYQQVTDSTGYFSFSSLPQETYRLEVTYVSCAPYEITFTVLKDTSLQILLDTKNNTLKEVTIFSGKPLSPSANIELSHEEIVRKGSVLGETNIYEALQKQAGIIHTSELNSGLFVRGFNSGNTAMLLDGINTFSGNHLLGIYPPVNADAFENIQLLKDNIHPKYNGYLASYLLLETENNVPDSVHTNAELGILTSKLGVQVPLVKNKLGIISNIRRSYFDLISNTYNSFNKNKRDYSPLPSYGFYDWNNTIILDSKAGLFKINTFNSSDRLNMDNAQLYLDAIWKNCTIGINWQYRLTDKLNMKINAGISDYQAKVSYKSLGRQLKNGITESTVAVDMHWTAAKSFYLDYGVYMKASKLKMSSLTLADADSMENSISINKPANNIGTYISGNISLSHDLQLKLGTNINRYSSNKEFYNIAPSLNLIYNKYKQGVLVSISRQLQFSHLYVPTGIQLPINIWYPSVQNAPPEDAWHFATTFSSVSGRKIKGSISVYYILLANQTEFLDKNYFSSLDFKTTQGSGSSRGIEFNLTYNSKTLQMEGHYTYGKSTCHFPGINGGKEYSLPYDIRHKADFSLLWQFKPQWSFSLSQYVQSGSIITMPTGLYIHQNVDVSHGDLQPVPVYTERNNYRMPLNHRMDISVKHTFNVKNVSCSWNGGFYNVYAYQNPYFVYFVTEKKENGDKYLQAKTKSILPLVPFISIKAAF
ncbi:MULTISPECIES: TonB-dependent receptor [Niastella]|uniref:TonB-dependent receptor n=1 Tax=Niastella soli TaxID=2821487 RepID=A0ABS3YYN9_9BACT|nr:TonB-dependent receptor [Niastella soli]MBO9203047.1 TonB-dependent receptor [Niastella soli]